MKISEIIRSLQRNLWFITRPKIIKDMIGQFPPYCKVRIKSTGQTAHLYSYNEDGTLTVTVQASTEFLPYRVFGLKCDDLERMAESPC